MSLLIKRETWLVIDVKAWISESWGSRTSDIGRSMIAIMRAAEAGDDPDLSDELTASLWSTMRAKSRVVRRSSVAPALRASIFERDGEVCRYCGAIDGSFELDHIHPVSKGVTDDPDNLGVACQPCNRSKSDKTLEEWRP